MKNSYVSKNDTTIMIVLGLTANVRITLFERKYTIFHSFDQNFFPIRCTVSKHCCKNNPVQQKLPLLMRKQN